MQGITIVPGNVWAPQGAEYMFHILDLLKRGQLTVATGRRRSADPHRRDGQGIGTPLGQARATSARSRRIRRRSIPLPAASSPPARPRRDAINLLISEIEHHPGDVTILALGPMTNIALALRMKPEIETKIKRIVFMGGNIRVAGNASNAAEFNFWFDPEAARIVLRSRIPNKVMFGLDICNLARIRKTEFDQIANAHTPVTDLYREDLGNRYPAFLKKPDAIGYMWDSLAAAYLLDPDFVTKIRIPLPRRTDHLGPVLRIDGAAGPPRRAQRHAGHGHVGPRLQARLRAVQRPPDERRSNSGRPAVNRFSYRVVLSFQAYSS